VNILVYFEIRDGQVKKASLEAASAAKKIADKTGGEVLALFIGKNIGDSAKAAGKAGIKKAVVVDADGYARLSNSIYAKAVAETAKNYRSDAVFFSATSMGKDLAPLTAAFLDAGFISDAVSCESGADDIEFVRPIYAGKALQRVSPAAGSPFVVTLRPNVFPFEEDPVDTAVESFSPAVDFSAKTAVVESIEKGSGELLDVAEADIIVSGGRGMKGPENFPMLSELAKLLGGAMGASRAAVDAGWVPHAHQVGQTGKVVAPTLYIACGISGAIQHLAGMSSSKVVVGINKDKEAPIFGVATYGLVGDLFEIVPLLTKEIKALKEQG
jgi:electron transfer flavoprotein alpha subunit